ncbi:MAG TPA: HlyD family efflux transporter periplasmic adaptor subunit [Pirellulales bacterium]|nr:HlyD family efflux transporter periplasmic adaptor subunit [Pirellulales bacterium]
MKKFFVLALLVAVGIGVGVWWVNRPRAPASEFSLYGNIDLRQVQLAFNNSERIAAVLVQEGDRVEPGQLLARLDTRRLEPQVKQAEAQAAAQKQALQRLRNGSRPEEIGQARANVAAAKADSANARSKLDRDQKLTASSRGGAVSEQDLDNSKAAFAAAEAKLAYAQQSLELAIAGPRQEDIEEAEARWQAGEAQLAFLRQQLADADLLAPTQAVVRTRLMEPGEIASPQRPVFSLAIIDPKWVRAYLSESELGKVRPGMPAAIKVDSFPQRRFEGWIGFISPVAEFTPKTVQTEELRTSLVFEVRVFIKDPDDVLRLGMPATVYLKREPPPSGNPPASDSPVPSSPVPRLSGEPPAASAAKERR